MSGTDRDTELRALDPSAWASYLDAHSGLPGPRANLSLVDAVVRVGDAATAARLLDAGGEYAAMCAAAILASRADEPGCESRAQVLAGDARWRVREGVAIGLQHLGDRSLEALLLVVGRWGADADPLVQRAAVAATCEPRLLRSPGAAAAAVELCRAATDAMARLPGARRTDDGVRSLRKTLGYAWSVAVAADPEHGLPAFGALDVSQPDVAWIVAENRRKKRLQRLL